MARLQKLNFSFLIDATAYKQFIIIEDDLPSERSVGRFVDMGQVLEKIQVASALTKNMWASRSQQTVGKT